jgi:carbon-monoxide dehydrogenase medium subunit
MIPAAFDYAAPSSLDEAIGLLQQHGDEAKLLAGGHSLLPLMKLRLAVPGLLVDLGRISDLAYIRDQGDHVAIGAMTTHFTLESSALLKQRLPLLSEAAGLIGDMQVRNRGTIGGSLAHADPAGDLPSVVTALDGQIVARGPTGERTIAAQDFFLDIWTSALTPDEVVTEIRLPYAQGKPAQAYEKFRQRACDWALVGVAVNLTRENGTIGKASVVLTNVGTTAVRAEGVEGALQGQPATAETVQAAAEHAAEGLEPSPELKASPDYKRHLARVLTRRALEAALQLR